MTVRIPFTEQFFLGQNAQIDFEDTVEKLVDFCLKHIKMSHHIQRLRNGEEVGIIIPSKFSMKTALKVVKEFQNSEGWNCSYNHASDEPWLTFSIDTEEINNIPVVSNHPFE